MAEPPCPGTPPAIEGQRASTLTLVLRGIDGDVAAANEGFSRLVQRIHRWTHRRFPNRFRSDNDSMDLVQSVFIGFWRNRSRVRLERAGDLDAYFRESVRRRIINLTRRPHGFQQPLELKFEVASDDRSPLDLTMGEAASCAVQAALARVSERERMLIIARFNLEYSYAEIASLWCFSSADAARMAVNRAVSRLASFLESDAI